MLLGFNRRFAPFVEDGSKTHTIRAGKRWRPGMRCDCYVDPRQKTMRLLGRWPCVKVEPIRITEQHTIIIYGQVLDFEECNALAWRDGFRDSGPAKAFPDMMEFWTGRLPFEGQIIHWSRT